MQCKDRIKSKRVVQEKKLDATPAELVKTPK